MLLNIKQQFEKKNTHLVYSWQMDINFSMSCCYKWRSNITLIIVC